MDENGLELIKKEMGVKAYNNAVKKSLELPIVIYPAKYNVMQIGLLEAYLSIFFKDGFMALHQEYFLNGTNYPIKQIPISI